jgi:hypothetical protein
MQLLKRLAGSENKQKKSTLTVRFVAPLVLAFLVFGVVGVFSSGHASAHAVPSSTCSNVVVAGPNILIGYESADFSTVSLVQNTCTKLYVSQVTCASSEAITLGFFVLTPVSGGSVFSTPNTINTTCTKAGQILNSAPLAFVANSQFCADATSSSGTGYSCIGND